MIISPGAVAPCTLASFLVACPTSRIIRKIVMCKQITRAAQAILYYCPLCCLSVSLCPVSHLQQSDTLLFKYSYYRLRKRKKENSPLLPPSQITILIFSPAALPTFLWVTGCESLSEEAAVIIFVVKTIELNENMMDTSPVASCKHTAWLHPANIHTLNNFSTWIDYLVSRTFWGNCWYWTMKLNQPNVLIGTVTASYLQDN